MYAFSKFWVLLGGVLSIRNLTNPFFCVRDPSECSGAPDRRHGTSGSVWCSHVGITVPARASAVCGTTLLCRRLQCVLFMHSLCTDFTVLGITSEGGGGGVWGGGRGAAGWVGWIKTSVHTAIMPQNAGQDSCLFAQHNATRCLPFLE